jgi:FtsH-binding integral membrane protein
MMVMTVAGSVCCSFSSSSPCKNISLCSCFFFFFAFLVCFCLVLLLLVSGGGGAAIGFQTVRWRLLAGGIVVGGDGGSSPLYADA